MSVLGGLDHAELDGVPAVYGDGGHRHLGALLHVVLDHAHDVHAVDVIAAEDRHHVRVGLLHQVDVLVNRVRSALVPGLAGRAHLRRHGDDELRFQQAAELPALAHVLQQRLAAELRQHVDRVDSGVDEITEDEIDNAIFAAEGNRRLSAFLGKRVQPGTLPAGQHDAQHSYTHRWSSHIVPQFAAVVCLLSKKYAESARRGVLLD